MDAWDKAKKFLTINLFTELIPDALSSTCAKCTDKQKVLVAKVIKTMMDSHAEGWEKLRGKFDPEHTHDDDLKQFIEKHYA